MSERINYPMDVLVQQIRQIEKQADDIHKKHPSFQDNFSRFMISLMQAQYHLSILNQECFLNDKKHEIVITNLEDC